MRPKIRRIHPAKAVVTADLTVALNGYHFEQVFDTERSEGEHLDVAPYI